MHRRIVVFLLVFIALVGCQSESEKPMPGSDQDIKEVQLSNFEGLGSMNEEFKQGFHKDGEIQIFQNAIKKAKKQEDLNIKNYDYDIKLTLQDGGNKGIHLTKNEDDEIIMKYIGDSTDTYIVNTEDSKDLINLIYE